MTAESALYDEESPAAPSRHVGIPYEGGELPGCLFLVDGGGSPRPTIIHTNGFGATRADGYLAMGEAALSRGYNFLVYDGPGQGAMLRDHQVPMRPDWENVLGPVVDWALGVPEIDGEKIVQIGDDLGAYFVARHASHDHRSAAIVCNDAMTTFYAAYPHVPEPILELVEDDRDDDAAAMLDTLMTTSPATRWALQNGQRVCGVDSAVDYVRTTAEYTLTAADIHRITTPALVLEWEDDTVFAGQAANLVHAMTAPVHHVVVRSDDVVHEKVFGYLATTLHR
ncbi:hypothetical protein [Mycolicibacterium sp.]|uniref:alpha/beta hydrolase family protein n=1 Tax=Mycolicibacterium sp. TaxID=2320850 RepID=UPI001A23A8D3|nr:hypothetical protein [Mycolicibacterium sp.]MBJ7336951.1 hypothetical protein [Mycolicibacterium sp.]